MKIVEVRHPLVQHKLGKLRDVGTDPVLFRQLASEIAAMLAYEATREMPVETRSVPTWAGPLDVAHVRAEKVTLVPILRAGLGFLPGVQAMLPAAAVSVIGLRRNEATHQPETYYERLADHMGERTAMRMIIWKAFCTLVTSVVRRVMIEEVLNLSILEKE